MSNRLSLSERASFLYRAWRHRWSVAPAEVRFVRQQLRPGHRCVEVGGRQGAFTYWMQRSVGRAGQVFTFEPQSERAAYLLATKETFNLRQLEIVPAAVSSSSGQGQWPCRIHRAARRVKPSLPTGADEDVSPVRVETLDEFFIDRPGRPIDLIRCDVKGHELEIFRGAEAILAEDRPLLLFACEQRHHGVTPIAEVFRYLELFEYVGQFFQSGRLKPLSEFDPENNRFGEPGYVHSFVFRPKPERAARIDMSEWALQRRAG